jgi:hypothetical protein
LKIFQVWSAPPSGRFFFSTLIGAAFLKGSLGNGFVVALLPQTARYYISNRRRTEISQSERIGHNEH